MLPLIALLTLLITLVSHAIGRRFTIWTRQGIPTDYGLAFEQGRVSMFEADQATVRKHGKVVG